MRTEPLHFQPRGSRQPERIALLGNPNCGKTALFNLLTGSRQKVANYAGVTVERKEGIAVTPRGRSVFVLDLPGTYSLHAASADEAVARDVVTGRSKEPMPDLLVCVTDATNLRLSLLNLLRQASDRELSGDIVSKSLTTTIRDQHVELLRQQQILASQRLDRAALDDDLKDALLRYRALKAPPGAAATAKPDAQAGPAPAAG